MGDNVAIRVDDERIARWPELKQLYKSIKKALITQLPWLQ